MSMFVSIPSRQKAPLRWATPLLFVLLWAASSSRPSCPTRRSSACCWTGARCPAAWRHRRSGWPSLRDGRVAAPVHRPVPARRLGAPAGQPGVPADLRAAGGAGDGAVAACWLLFLLGGAVANLAAVIAIGTPDRLIIGASGAVSALIGAYLALFPAREAGRGGAAGAVPAIRESAGGAADRHLGAAAVGVHLHRPGLRRGGLVGAPGGLRVRRACSR